jgi:asparagine synthetase B (glutamine-hydrolysing)
MASSLELRVPFVDARLQRAARSSARGTPRPGKADLARRLAPELPAHLFTRRKTDFSTPFAAWLDGGSPGPAGRHSRTLARRILLEWGLPLARPVA